VIARAVVAPTHPGAGVVAELMAFHETVRATTLAGYFACALLAAALAAGALRRRAAA